MKKPAAIHTLTLRDLNYCITKELLDQERSHITQVFWDNGLPLPAIQRIIKMESQSKEAMEFENLEEARDDQTPPKPSTLLTILMLGNCLKLSKKDQE